MFTTNQTFPRLKTSPLTWPHLLPAGPVHRPRRAQAPAATCYLCADRPEPRSAVAFLTQSLSHLQPNPYLLWPASSHLLQGTLPGQLPNLPPGN